jgi:glycyl-tRNA synthetase beta chain
MKKNQKIFACYDAKGRLGSQASLADSQAGKMENQFVAVMNGKRNGLAKIRADYENVLDSRLKDARYFYEMDTKESFEKKKPKLAELVYLGKLGSVLDKTERLEKLAPEFAKAAGHPKLAEDLKRVACLSKIDLVTHLVYEMPDLQGIVGREYAREAREKEEVALAIGAQYLPRNLTEDYQKIKDSMDLLGALFGIMDRLDLLIGALGSGIEPTGSQDPFALRRAGGVMVKLIRAFGISFPLGKVLEENVKLYAGKLTKLDGLTIRMMKFLQERVSFELGVKPGTRPYEILQAVTRSSSEDVANMFRRFEALNGTNAKVLNKAAKVIQRTANMLKNYGKTSGELKEELLVEEHEKKLFEFVRTKAQDVAECIDKKEYEKATKLFADIFSTPLHDFFDHVLVNAEDAALRENRMALVSKINRLYTARIADLSALSRIDEE